MKKTIRRKKIIIVSMFLLCAVGLGLLSYNYILAKINLTFETVNLQLYGNSVPEEVNAEDVDDEENAENSDSSSSTSSENNYSSSSIYKAGYVAYLEIPAIALSQGLVALDDSNNDVSKNIQTIYPSDWPDVDGGNLILAAHSGTSSISYFKNLYKLSTGDTINIYYNDIKYTYKITNIYDVEKNGQVAIYRDPDTTTVTLITCTKDSDTLQTVYIGSLESKEGVS